ncbi:MAG: hypothetical protein QNM02_20670 [Acidimicrobiia bacterium]|nr:hypothetical protein [Acidimicrobiia bacterium]
MNDDGEAPQTAARYGPFAIAIVTMSIVVWPIAFNLGAFGEVFYLDVFQFVVVASAGLGISLLSSPYHGGRRLFTSLALAAPAAWFVLAVVVTESTAEAATGPVLGPLAFVIAVVAVPVVLKMVTDMFVPGFRAFDQRKLLYGGLAIIVAIAVVSFAAGRNNQRFLTCGDFKVAGSDQPSNCQQE